MYEQEGPVIKIGISVALEKRLREWDPATASALVEEVIELIESARSKQANRQAMSGVSYTEILRWFREALGNGLAVPPAPSDWWIGRQVTRAREIGLKQDDVARIAAGAKRLYPRGPWELEFLLRAAPRLIVEYEPGNSGGPGKVVGRRTADDE